MDVARMPAMQEEPRSALDALVSDLQQQREEPRIALSPARVGLEGAPVAWHRPLRERQSELRGELPAASRLPGNTTT